MFYSVLRLQSLILAWHLYLGTNAIVIKFRLHWSEVKKNHFIEIKKHTKEIDKNNIRLQ